MKVTIFENSNDDLSDTLLKSSHNNVNKLKSLHAYYIKKKINRQNRDFILFIFF